MDLAFMETPVRVVVRDVRRLADVAALKTVAADPRWARSRRRGFTASWSNRKENRRKPVVCQLQAAPPLHRPGAEELAPDAAFGRGLRFSKILLR